MHPVDVKAGAATGEKIVITPSDVRAFHAVVVGVTRDGLAYAFKKLAVRDDAAINGVARSREGDATSPDAVECKPVIFKNLKDAVGDGGVVALEAAYNPRAAHV